MEPRKLTLLVMLFVSGACGLAFEVMWVRALGLWFGTSTSAVTIVVASFMGGLALGNVLFGGIADRHPNPLRLYALLELGVAVSGAIVSVIVLRGQSFAPEVALAVSSSSKFWVGAMSFGLLLVPTTLMGGTLPVLARAIVRHGEGAGRTLGRLYAANTAGAVLGALVPDALTVPTIGLLDSTLLAAVGDLSVSLGAFFISNQVMASAVAVADGPVSRSRKAALVLFATSGFCALGYEIAWARILEHIVSGEIVCFAVLLSVYLAALALGSAIGGAVVAKLKSPLFWASLAMGLTALFAFVPLLGLSWWLALVDRLAPIDPLLQHPGPGWTWRVALMHSLYLEGVPSVLMGFAFPCIAAAAVVGPERAGRQTGTLYSLNVIAGVVGSLITGFVLLPLVGMQTSLLVLSLASALVALAVTIETTTSHPTTGQVELVETATSRVRLFVTALPLLLVTIAGIAWPTGRLNAVLFDLTEPPLHLEEGRTTSIAVTSHSTFGVERYRELKTPGASMSDTSFGARRYMSLSGHLPLLFAAPSNQPRRALLICYGVGNTARGLLSHPELGRLDVVDTSAEVLRASPYFAAVTGSDPLVDARTHVTVDDGRHFLNAAAAHTYDVITSEPPPPIFAGVVNLYSREYYAAARRALKPGGVIAQWFPVFQLTLHETESLIAAMQVELPYVVLFQGSGFQWVALGSDQPLVVDGPRWRALLALPSVRSDLSAVGIDDATQLAALQLADDAHLRSVISTEPMSDDLPLLQYRMQPIQKHNIEPLALISLEFASLEKSIEPAELEAFRARAQVVRFGLSSSLLSAGSKEGLELLNAPWLHYALSLAPHDEGLLTIIGLDQELAFVAAHATREAEPEAKLLLARRAFYLRQWQQAGELLGAGAEGESDAAIRWLLRGGVARALGNENQAALAFRTSAGLSTDREYRARLAKVTASTPDESHGPLQSASVK